MTNLSISSHRRQKLKECLAPRARVDNNYKITSRPYTADIGFYIIRVNEIAFYSRFVILNYFLGRVFQHPYWCLT